jgi:lipopolysaccharide/colanic/teichoic acid biosynthesis glycosyltransferase
MKNLNYSYSYKLFWTYKRSFDIFVSLLLLPLLFIISMFLFVLNRFFNRGELFFIQERMGKNCKVFTAIKFRSMSPINEITRKYDEPIEINRITPLGGILRKMRIDELPQILNVLKGDMSLIGPRPDYYLHALEYLNSIKGYRERYIIRPGITGLSQVSLGYAESLEATSKKTNIDNFYINNIGYIIDIKIIISTLRIITFGLGK